MGQRVQLIPDGGVDVGRVFSLYRLPISGPVASVRWDTGTVGAVFLCDLRVVS